MLQITLNLNGLLHWEPRRLTPYANQHINANHPRQEHFETPPHVATYTVKPHRYDQPRVHLRHQFAVDDQHTLCSRLEAKHFEISRRLS